MLMQDEHMGSIHYGFMQKVCRLLFGWNLQVRARFYVGLYCGDLVNKLLLVVNPSGMFGSCMLFIRMLSIMDLNVINQAHYSKRIKYNQQDLRASQGQMKQEDPTQVKLLHKKFHFLNKTDITTIYDFCQQNFTRTEKILTVMKDQRNPKSIVRLLLSRPEKGQSLLSSFQKRYDEDYRELKNVQAGKIMNESKSIFIFFNYVPKDVLLSICMYLDPYSLANLSMTCQKMAKTHDSVAFEQYYRNICVNLFQNCQARLPEPCRFIQARNYIFQRRNQFGPNTRNAVTNNLRYYIWQRYPEPQKLQPNSLVIFGNYRNLFYQLPRVHFNGIYVCRHQTRKQDKNLVTNVSQVHYIVYYRYLRFFEDGSVLHAVFPAKQKLQYICSILSSTCFDTQQGKFDKAVMVGQFVQDGSNINVKLLKQGAVFSYSLQLTGAKENQRQFCNCLLIKKYEIKVLDEKDIEQVLEEYNSQNPSLFRYHHLEAISKENSRLVAASSL